MIDRGAHAPAKTGEQLQAELRRSEQRYRDLLQALPVAAYTTDTTGVIAMFNDAAVGLWGRAPERGRKWCGSARMFTPDGEELAPEDSPMAVTIRERRTQSQVEIIVGRSDGSRRNVLAHPHLLYDEDGRPSGAVNFLVNITAQCRAEAELALAADTLTRLHELSTVRLAAAPELPDSLQGVLNALVALSGADFGLLSLFDPELSTLRAAASVGFDPQALETLGTVVPARGVGPCGTAFGEGLRVVVEDVESDPAFTCHRATASSIGYRAVHSTPIITRSGEVLGVLSVHFRAAHRPSPHHLQIADICAREAADTVAAIRQHDGPGRASELLEVRVPPFADDASEAPIAHVRRLCVVVADDNEDAAAGLELLLEAMGHEVHVAHDGVDAVELAERVHPDAIVLDIGMPRLSGLEACRLIRQQAWATDAVIVALTGWGQAEDQRRSFDAGFDHHVVKPCDRTSLAVMLEHGRRQ